MIKKDADVSEVAVSRVASCTINGVELSGEKDGLVFYSNVNMFRGQNVSPELVTHSHLLKGVSIDMVEFTGCMVEYASHPLGPLHNASEFSFTPREDEMYMKKPIVAVVSEEEFSRLGNGPLPSWVGCFARDNTVVYSEDYWLKCLQCEIDPKFCAPLSVPEFVIGEFRHEHLHAVEGRLYFREDAELFNSCYRCSPWVPEGFKVILSFDYHGQEIPRLRQMYRDDLTGSDRRGILSMGLINAVRVGDYCGESLFVNQLNKGMWVWDTDPPHNSFGYLYAAEFLRQVVFPLVGRLESVKLGKVSDESDLIIGYRMFLSWLGDLKTKKVDGSFIEYLKIAGISAEALEKQEQILLLQITSGNT